MKSIKTSHTRKLNIIIILSALGSISSLFVGYAANLVSFIPLGPISGQIFSGLHVFWLVIVAVLAKKRGAATMAGALKGVVEMILPNHIGPFVFLMSLLEGVIVDVILLPVKRVKLSLTLLAAGLSSASNIVILQIFQFLPSSFPFVVYAAMYFASFMSGVIFGGYLSIKTMIAIQTLTHE